MKKPKIAISVDKSLLELIDSKVDGSVIRSRSQERAAGADNKLSSFAD